MSDIGSEQLVDALFIQPDRPLLRKLPMHIHNAVHDLAAAKLLDQLACSIDCSNRVVRIQPLFKNTGGIRTKAETLRRFSDVRAVKGRGLKQNGFYMLRDF